MIQVLLDSHHPHMSVESLYTFLWCIWKARNDSIFCRKACNPSQVYAVAMAIIQGAKLEFEAYFQVCSEGDLNDPHVDANTWFTTAGSCSPADDSISCKHHHKYHPLFRACYLFRCFLDYRFSWPADTCRTRYIHSDGERRKMLSALYLDCLPTSDFSHFG